MHTECEYKLVLANGAFKSGSTWLREIVKHLRRFDPIPEAYASRRLPHWIREERIERFLNDHSMKCVCLSKSHIYLPEVIRKLRKHRNIRVLNIKRDIRDVVVSAYYHYKRTSEREIGFSEYYWRIGRFKAHEVMEYNQNWSADDGAILFTEYESLKKDFHAEVAKIALFLGIEASDERIGRIQEKTSIENLRKSRGEEALEEGSRFFRKGVIGDWKNHFSEDELKDVANIEESGLAGVSYIKYWCGFPMRRRALRFKQRLFQK